MKKIFLSVVFLFVLSGFCLAQNVTVTQEFLGDCTKAFVLVTEQRDALEKYKNERAKTDAERAALEAVIKGLNDLLSIKDQTIEQYKTARTFETAQYEAIIKMQAAALESMQKAFEAQGKIIEQLQKMLNKPKSLFSKILATVEKVLYLAAGVALGRGF